MIKVYIRKNNLCKIDYFHMEDGQDKMEEKERHTLDNVL